MNKIFYRKVLDKTMAINWDEYIRLTTLEANLYSLEIYNPKEGLTIRDKYSILDKLHKRREKHPHVSFLYVESTTSKVKGFKYIHTGKPGRPKKHICGNKVAGHVHIAIIGTSEKSAYKYVKDVKEAINKRFLKSAPYTKRCRSESKGNREHAINYINYCLNQADLKRTAGDFNFYEFQSYPSLSG